MEAYLIGLEIGTTRAKAGIFTLDGKFAGKSSREYALHTGYGEGAATSNPLDWWFAVKEILKEICSVINKANIRGITVGSHGPSLVALDKEGIPIGPSILWMDRRALKEADQLSLKISRKTKDIAWFVPRAMWLKKNKPLEFKKVKYLLQPLDYINFNLTGEFRATQASEFITPWSKELVDASGLDPDLFPPFVKMGENVGRVTSAAASETGLPIGMPVFAGTGGADFVETLIGNAVVEKGIICDKGGTSQGIELCWDKQLEENGTFSCPHPLVNGFFHVGGLMSTTGKALQWYKEKFYPEESDYKDVFSEAAQSPLGAKKLIFLPYMMGARTPWWDVNARGNFFGISLEHGRGDFARAILEGVAYGIGSIIGIFEEAGVNVKEIRACSGQSKSSLWNQIKADVCGVPVKTSTLIDGDLLGLAIIAGKGIGVYDDIASASRDLVAFDKVYEPKSVNHAFYVEMRNIYAGLYPKLKDSFSSLAELGKGPYF